jgi:hypothetical protein
LTFHLEPNGVVLNTAQLRSGNFALVEFAAGVEQILGTQQTPYLV